MSEAATASWGQAAVSLSDMPLSLDDLEPQAEPEIYCIQRASAWRFTDSNSRSLRLGERLSSVWSARGVGLIAATFAASWTAASLHALAPLLATELLLFSGEDVRVMTRGTQLLAALATWASGLVADSHSSSNDSQPRWRIYWAIGAVVAACSLLALASISLALEADGSSSGKAAISVVFVAVTAVGGALMELSTLTRAVELSQCESLRRRGSVLGAYVVIQCVSAAVANLFCFAVADSTALEAKRSSKVAVSTALFVAGSVAVAPIPIVFRYWRKSLSGQVNSLHVPVLLRIQLLWQVVNQRAALRIVAFQLLFTLTTNLQFRDSTVVVSSWAGASGDSDFLVAVLQSVIAGIALMIWKRTWLNRSWRFLFLLSAFLVVTPQLIVAVFVAGVAGARDRYFYRIGMAVMYIGQGLATLASVMPLIEIVQEGMEGSMVGLAVAIRLIVEVFQATAATGIFRGDHFYNLDKQLASTAPSSGQWKVVGSLVLNFSIIAIGAVAAVIIFLPTQKIETQQLRKHGGYSQRGSLAVFIALLALVAFSVIANALTLVSGLKCSVIASGIIC
jgi:hypothetical protein